MLEKAVHLRRGYASAAFRGDLFEKWKDLFRSLASLRRNKHNWRIVQELEFIAQALLVSIPIARPPAFAHALGFSGAPCFFLAADHQVPLVDHNDGRAAAFMGVSRDRGVELADAFGGIDDQQCDI